MCLRVDSQWSGTGRGDLTIRGAGDDHTVQSFGVPARFDQIGCQPIEELRMGRRAALGAEVCRGGDQADAKMHTPDSVRGNPGSYRILPLEKPVLLVPILFQPFWTMVQ